MDSLNNDNIDPINTDSATSRSANTVTDLGETRDRNVRDIDLGDTRDAREGDANRDPISGAPGAHPVGTGVGAAGGAAAGAAIGAVGGPVGALVGGAIGAVAGGLAGKGAAEAINPTVEDEYWRENYSTRPYATADRGYEYYQPAYRYGWESRAKHAGKEWDSVAGDLQKGWDKARGASKMEWNEARSAVSDAWHRPAGGLSSNLMSDGGL